MAGGGGGEMDWESGVNEGKILNSIHCRIYFGSIPPWKLRNGQWAWWSPTEAMILQIWKETLSWKTFQGGSGMDWGFGISRCKLLDGWAIRSCCRAQGILSSHLWWNMMEDNVRKRMCVCVCACVWWGTFLHSRKENMTEYFASTIKEKIKIFK